MLTFKPGGGKYYLLRLPLTKESLKDIQVRVKISQSGKDKFRSTSEIKTPKNYWDKKYKEIEGVE